MRIMTNAERSKAIRDRIKAELGYNSRQVGIRSGDCGYSDYTRITIKDLSCDIDAIKKIAKSYESIRRCEYSGEILSGANTYVTVEYDYKVLNAAQEAELDNAAKAIAEASDFSNPNRNQTFYTDKTGGRYVIVPVMDDNQLRYSISYFEAGKSYGNNITYGCVGFDSARWTVAKYLAINKAKAA